MFYYCMIISADSPVCAKVFRMVDCGSFNYSNGSHVITGRIEACIDNTFYPVCASGLNTSLHSSSPTNYLLDGVCKDILSSGEF